MSDAGAARGLTLHSRHGYRWEMARLPYVDPETAPEVVRQVFAGLSGRLNIFGIVAHAPTLFGPLVALGDAVLVQQVLDARLRELAILRVARLSPARYVWAHHVQIALDAGVAHEQIEALERGESEVPCFDESEQLVLRFTTEVLRDVRATDLTFAAMVQRFTAREVLELLWEDGEPTLQCDAA